MVDYGPILTAQLVSFGVLAIPTVLVLASLIHARQHHPLLRLLLAVPTIFYPLFGPLMVVIILFSLEVRRWRERGKRKRKPTADVSAHALAEDAAPEAGARSDHSPALHDETASPSKLAGGRRID